MLRVHACEASSEKRSGRVVLLWCGLHSESTSISCATGAQKEGLAAMRSERLSLSAPLTDFTIQRSQLSWRSWTGLDDIFVWRNSSLPRCLGQRYRASHFGDHRVRQRAAGSLLQAGRGVGGRRPAQEPARGGAPPSARRRGPRRPRIAKVALGRQLSTWRQDPVGALPIEGRGVARLVVLRSQRVIAPPPAEQWNARARICRSG